MFALEPGDEGRIYLEKHLSLPESERPYLVVVALSAKESRSVAKEFDSLFSTDENGKTLEVDDFQDKITSMFQKYVKSWNGFRDGDAEDVFTRNAMLEVIRSFIGGRLDYNEKKE